MVHFTVDGEELNEIDKKEEKILEKIKNFLTNNNTIEAPILVKKGQYDILGDPIAEHIDNHVLTVNAEMDNTPEKHTTYFYNIESFKAYLEGPMRMIRLEKENNELRNKNHELKERIIRLEERILIQNT